MDDLSGEIVPGGLPVEETPIERLRRRDRERKARERAEATSRINQPFVGVDGEGGNDANGKHLYVLLRCGDNYIQNPHGLSTTDVLEFLCSQPDDVQLVGFAIDYDVTHWLHDLPPFLMHQLLHPEERKRRGRGARANLEPVTWRDFDFDYVRGKEFKVRRITEKNWRTISDVFGFFQSSFVRALQAWKVASDEQLAAIIRGKSTRHAFGTSLSREDIGYNKLECDLLVDLMDKLRIVCYDSGCVPGKWQGPGWLAAQMLQQNKVAKSEQVRDWIGKELWDDARAAFYGGRFEAVIYGAITKDVHEYDINSAYPAAITKLPCLEHGKWTRQNYRPAPGTLYLAHGYYDTDNKPTSFVYGFPHRDKTGSITFRSRGAGWYWSCEIEAAVRHQNFTGDIYWVYTPRCSCKPFAWVPEMFRRRKLLGKDRGLVLKLALNSLYGKMVQSTGSAPYANPVWGSLITAMVRAQLKNAICADECGDDCGMNTVMMATDGIYTLVKLPVKVGDNLGEWEYKYHPARAHPYERFFVVKSGIYFATAQDAKVKTRGVNAQTMTEKRREFYEKWYQWIEESLYCMRDLKEAPTLPAPVVSIPGNSFLNMNLAMAWGRYKELGQWRNECPDPDCEKVGNHVHKNIEMTWVPKRRGARRVEGVSPLIDPILWKTSFRKIVDNAYVITFPLSTHKFEESVPYGKYIGGEFDKARKLAKIEQSTFAEGEQLTLIDLTGGSE